MAIAARVAAIKTKQKLKEFYEKEKHLEKLRQQHALKKSVVTKKQLDNLYEKLNEGYDLVSGWKKNRKDPLNKRLPSKLFNFVTRLVTGVKIHDFNCGLKAYSINVIKDIWNMAIVIFPSFVFIGMFCRLGSLEANLPVFVAASKNDV